MTKIILIGSLGFMEKEMQMFVRLRLNNLSSFVSTAYARPRAAVSCTGPSRIC